MSQGDERQQAESAKTAETGSQQEIPWQEGMEDGVEDLDQAEKIHYSFLFNAANQLNVSHVKNSSYTQNNLLFLWVSPYFMEDFQLEDLAVSIQMDPEGRVCIDGKEFEAYEIKPGIRVFGLSSRE